MPTCLNSLSDPDGDGFGWENRQSCRVAVVASSGVCRSAASDPDGDGYGWENGRSCRVTAAPVTSGTCVDPSSDPDGDGFGWENGRSCRVVAASNSKPVCRSAGSDNDGDGFGWENGQTCVVGSVTNESNQGQSASLSDETYRLPHPACSHARYDSNNDGYGWENSTTCTTRNFGDAGASITDLVLVTGQSNALGAETVQYDNNRFDLTQDSPVRRVYAYTNTGWTIAGLRQIWDLNWYPRSDISNDPANNFAFHFAKQIAREDPGAVVGIILITAPGEAISHWDRNGEFYSQIRNKVRQALAALPHKQQIDSVLWHQGESDYYDTPYYTDTLNALIRNLRAENWVDPNATFICGETLNAPVNAGLNRLNSDGDNRTGCVSSAGLQSVGDDIHFTAASLRELGARYARKYLALKSR